ncbi:MAG TPA: hypothetical protein VK886_21705 [Vicinamibacterales bacterium]|nr:hypothetical protein [Vicinamibacterales bacterium]
MRPIVRTAALSGAIVALSAPFHAAAPRAASSSSSSQVERFEREVTIPAGTVLRLRVTRGFGSDFSRVEDPVSATLARSIVIGGRTVLPAGSRVSGYVSDARRPGKVKGRGRVAVRFTRVVPANDSEAYTMRTRPWVAVAPASKKKDAATIGIPAAGGAIVGALVDGKKGAGIGAAVGGGAGTAVVLTTRGRDVRVGRGAVLAVRLTQPLTIRIDE